MVWVMIDFLAPFFNDAVQIAQKLQMIGSDAYTCAADGHFDVVMDKSRAQWSTSLEDVFEAQAKGRCRIDRDFESELYINGFSEFAHLVSSVDTHVFMARHGNGHDYTVSINLPPQERKAAKPGKRIIMPLVLQPYLVRKNDGVTSEVLPIVQMLETEETPVPQLQAGHALDDREQMVLDRVLREFMHASQCTSKNDLLSKDTAVLPDGTPIQVDRGTFIYGPNSDAYMALVGFHIHQSKYAPMYTSERWIRSNCHFAQDRFFLNPFDHTPKYRDFLIAR